MRPKPITLKIERAHNRPSLEQIVRLCVEVYGNPRFLLLCGYSEEESLRMMDEFRQKKEEKKQ